MKTSASALLLLLGLYVESTTASCGHGTSLLKRKVTISKRQEAGGENGTVKTVEVGQFGYKGTQGPTNWAGLSAENALCATSKQQSPIDITNSSTTLTAIGDLAVTIPNVEAAEFENLGTTIEVVLEGKGASTTVGGKTFELKQFHFHSPSEHTVDGEYFPLEMHMVHEAEDGAIAVIAAQFQLSETGETTSLLTSVVENIGAITTPGSVTETGPLDFAGLVKSVSEQQLHTYAGSLTTPPCAEGLTFFVTSQQLPLDVKTFNQIKSVVGFNARFTQNNVGEGNLLELSAALAASAGAAGGAANVSAPPAEAPAAAAPVAEAAPVAAAPVAAPVSAPVVVSGGPTQSGSTQTVSNSGDAASIIKGLTGLDLSDLGLKE